MNYVQIDICCKDLRRYLEYALASAHGGVITVKMNRVMQIAPPLQVSRSDVIRVAIMHLLNKIYAAEEESKYIMAV